MRVVDCEIVEDEGTRVLVAGTDEESGKRVAFHVVLSSDHGIELVERLREDPESVVITIPAQGGAEQSWEDADG